MRLFGLSLSCTLLFLLEAKQALSANQNLTPYKLDTSSLNEAIMNKEDQKTGRFALRHMGTGYFLSGYTSKSGEISMLIPTEQYELVRTVDGGQTVGIWDLSESLLKKRKAQLLVLEYSVTNPNDTNNVYACAQYSMNSTSPLLYNCDFDRKDEQMQQFMIDTDQGNSSIITIAGSNRKDCFGFAGTSLTAMSCGSSNAKWFIYGDDDADPVD
ncbi:MAG: hypothetical protein DHS80DRAFT_32606 [Piptocephalis tieghemiana]|nr:MAG: hypothetical protein DHS80DRAFT_32606 [Piptocephalis tieghemiana]